MSLASRVLGVILSLSGGYLIGNAQGMITISNAVGNFIYSLSMVTPGVGSMIGAYIQDVVTATLSANYGTYWVFGVLLACFGLMLVYRGDKKPRPPEEALPLLTEPLEVGTRN
jgi:hypothetical protein